MADLRNASTGVTLSRHVQTAATPWQRSIGFLLDARIEPQRGFWFARCRAIHTIGMRSAVDVLMLDAQGTIVAFESNVRPNRLYVSHRGTRAIVEMGPGFLRDARVRVGERLVLATGL